MAGASDHERESNRLRVIAAWGINAYQSDVTLAACPYTHRRQRIERLAWETGWRLAGGVTRARPFHVKPPGPIPKTPREAPQDPRGDPRGDLWHPYEIAVAQALRGQFTGARLAAALGRAHGALRQKFNEIDHAAGGAGGVEKDQTSSTAGGARAAQ